MKAKAHQVLPWLAAVAALAAASSLLFPARPVRGFALEEVGRLPVLESGRVKPLDTVARNALLLLRGKQTVPDGARSVPAIEWLLEVLFRPEHADQLPTFVIDDPELLGLLGLPADSGRYFSFEALRPRLDDVEQHAQAALAVEARARTRFQAAVVQLYTRLGLYTRLESTVELRGSGLAEEIAARGDTSEPRAARRREVLSAMAAFRPIAAEGGAAWRSVGEVLSSGDDSPALDAWARLGEAWRAQDGDAFGRAAEKLGALAAWASPDAARTAGRELVFNRAQPFISGMALYVAALLALFLSWIWRPEALQPVSRALLGAGALVHAAGLLARIALQGRPPVTNLYSSAVFVGFVAVLLALAVERVSRRGFGTAVGASSGFATLIVAHHLTGDGDTLEPMRAVLDSNFWLATHVVAITVGYGGTFVAGALGLAWTARQRLRPLSTEASRAVAGTTYGVLCFALFFSFVGTVLGGIWADQSWGRFWGWDPKENGALLIVLWNALILHARWGGFIRERGLMAMAVVGNAVTALSWFGVNMLGVGLHSYGFMDKALVPLAAFVASQLVAAGVALLPAKRAAHAAGA